MTKRSTEDTEIETEPTPDPEAPEANPDPAPEQVPFIARVEDPPPPPAEPEPEVRQPLPEGHVQLVYRGRANAFTHGDILFRPDQPVSVPSDVAEELLTYPNEPFALVDEDAGDAEPQKE